MQEYECEFGQPEGALLMWEQILNCVDYDLQQWRPTRLVRTGNFVAGGYDPARKRDGAAWVVAEWDGDSNQFIVRHVKVWHNVPIAQQVEYIRQCTEAWGIDKVCIDQTGLGGLAVYDELSDVEALRGRVEGVTFTKSTKTKMATDVALAIQDARMRLPDESDFLNEIAAIDREKLEGSQDDQFWALALAVHACVGGAAVAHISELSPDELLVGETVTSLNQVW